MGGGALTRSIGRGSFARASPCRRHPQSWQNLSDSELSRPQRLHLTWEEEPGRGDFVKFFALSEPEKRDEATFARSY